MGLFSRKKEIKKVEEIQIEEKKDTASMPKKIDIRKVMTRSGWKSYEAYINIIHMLEIGLIDSFESIDKQVIKDYKALRALKMLNKEEFSCNNRELMSYDDFCKWFYTKNQREAISDMGNGILTYDTLSKFFKVTLPEGLENTDANIASRIKTRISTVRDGDIFIMYSDKGVTSDVLVKLSPSLVICDNRYKDIVVDTNIPYILRRNLRGFIGDFSSIWRKGTGITTISITGTVGKTTTTEMIASVVSGSFDYFKVRGNQNTEKQVPGAVFRLNKNHEVFIQEAAGSFPGQLELSSYALTPDIFVITNIGTGHIGNYDGNRNLLLYEKLALDRHASENATGIINLDDEMLSRSSFVHDIKWISVKNPEADYYAADITETNGKITFDIIEKDGTKTPAVIHVCGIHNVYNALAAFAVGRRLGVQREAIVQSLLGFRTEGVRQNYVTYNGRNLYLDCYSTTTESIESTLLTMKQFTVSDKGRRILVLGDIIQPLGDKAESIHRNIGNMIADIGSTDEVFFFGNFLKFAYEEAVKRGVKCRYTDEWETVNRWVLEETDEKDVLCFKANHFSMFQKVIDNLIGTDFYYTDELTLSSPTKEENGIVYKLVEDYGAGVEKVKTGLSVISISQSIDGMPVRIISEGVFRNNNLIESVDICDNVMCISEESFAGCINLKDIKFGKGLRYVGVNSFKDCSLLERVDFTSSEIGSIDKYAFRSCKSLKKVIVPDSLKYLSENAFEHADNVEVICSKDSYAYARCMELGIRVRV